MNDRFEDKLPLISRRVKHIIDQTHKDVMTMLPEELGDQRIQITHRFNELVVSLNNYLYSMENTINDIQIDLLLEQTKMRLEKFKEKISSSTLTVQTFNAIFSELTECIEASFKTMSTIFKHTSIKTNKLAQENATLSIQVFQLHTDLKTTKEQLQKKIEALEKSELKRLNKERKNEKQILIRDLFHKARKRLCHELNEKHLSNIGLEIFYKSETDCIKLSSTHPLLFEILQNIAQEFGIDVHHMLIYLREKEKSNDTFHLSEQINKYAISCKRTKNYNLNDFMMISDMHSLDENDYLLLQPVFRRVCQIINQDT